MSLEDQAFIPKSAKSPLESPPRLRPELRVELHKALSSKSSAASGRSLSASVSRRSSAASEREDDRVRKVSESPKRSPGAKMDPLEAEAVAEANRELARQRMVDEEARKRRRLQKYKDRLSKEAAEKAAYSPFKVNLVSEYQKLTEKKMAAESEMKRLRRNEDRFLRSLRREIMEVNLKDDEEDIKERERRLKREAIEREKVEKARKELERLDLAEARRKELSKNRSFVSASSSPSAS
eukprot:ANDGO_04413.mRNA.1 hypothetical protein